MKRIGIIMALIMAISLTLSACGSPQNISGKETLESGIKNDPETIETVETTELTLSEKSQSLYVASLKMASLGMFENDNIIASDTEYKLISRTSGVVSVNIVFVFESSKKVVASLFSVDNEWILVFLSDGNGNYYWLDDDVKDYGNIIEWE